MDILLKLNDGKCISMISVSAMRETSSIDDIALLIWCFFCGYFTWPSEGIVRTFLKLSNYVLWDNKITYTNVLDNNFDRLLC